MHAVWRPLELRRPHIAIALAVALLCSTPARAQEQPEWLRSLEELMQMEVTSAAKREHRLADTSAAVFVLTRDDIRRSGMTTVPELLRLVPGVQVAQIDGNKWAVSVRGFNSRWANKLLVMVNGRSIYSRLFSGVFWDAIAIPVSEIERIEVVRGPGGSLWGTNAVNGVINIITRTTQSREVAVSATAGSFGTSSGVVQYAAPVNKWLRLHTYVDASHQGSLAAAGRDDWRDLRLGVGAGMAVSSKDQVIVEVRAFNGENWSFADESMTSLVPPATHYRPALSDSQEGTVAVRWKRTLPTAGVLDTSASYEGLRRDEGGLHVNGRFIEAAFQHTVPRKGRHEVTWGVQTQSIEDRVDGSASINLTADTTTESVFSALVQDEIGLAADRVTLTFGGKLERLQSSGYHVQPTARARWSPTAQQSIWAAVSKAVRTPSIIERGLDLNLIAGNVDGLPIMAHISGNPSMNAEALQAREAGYRWTTRRTSLDFAAYHNRYRGLTSLEPRQTFVTQGPLGPQLIVPFTYNNLVNASTSGVEGVAMVTPSPWARFVGSYSFFTLSSVVNPLTQNFRQGDGDTPRHQVTVRSLFSLPHRVEIDTLLARVSALDRMQIPAYGRVDTRIGWRSRNGLDLSLVIQNLLDDQHLEFDGGGAYVIPSLTRRRAWAAATWRF